MTVNSQSSFALVVPASIQRQLFAHLFPGDKDEHGAVLLAGMAMVNGELRLLVRDLVLASGADDYVPSSRGHRALSPMFVARVARRARDEGWAYLAVHNHGGRNAVAFSSVDMASHERGYPALVQMIGRPVGALVFAQNAVAGDLWMPDGARIPLSTARVLGRNISFLSPGDSGAMHDPELESLYDRQARMFGHSGQQVLADLRVAVVGLGGAGSMAAEMLARLGIGHLTLIDPDRLELHNLPRVVGSRMQDIDLRRGSHGQRRRSQATYKVDIAARAIQESGMPVKVVVIPTDVNDAAAAQSLTSCDWIVLAADSQQARLLVNAVAHAYLIPVTQVGVKIPVSADSGEVGDIFVVSRRVLPDAGCLWCNGLIDPTRLQLEAIDPEEARRARAYVGQDAPAPSVVTLNGSAVSTGLTDLLLAVTGLHKTRSDLPDATYQRWLPRTGRQYNDEPRRDPECPYCGGDPMSALARGDAATLPVRHT